MLYYTTLKVDVSCVKFLGMLSDNSTLKRLKA